MNNELIKKLRKEKYELSLKIYKLKNFIGSEKWKTIGSTQAFLLDIQLNTMKAYNDILATRISLLESESDINE